MLAMNKTIKTERIVFGIILVTAAVLRFIKLGDFSLTSDELSALNRLRYDSLSTVIAEGVMLDAHPPLVQLFLYGWTWLFGTTEFVFRLPFVICSLGSVVLIYRLGKNWFNAHTGLIAAALFTTLSYGLTYSQLARPYAPGLLFSLLLLHQLTLILYIEHKPTTKRYLWFMVALLLCMYTHYYCLVFAFIAGLIGLWRTNKITRRPYVLACIGASILFIPNLPILLYQFATGGGGTGGESGWLGPPKSDWILDYLFYAFNQSWYFIAVVGSLLLLGLLANIRNFRISRFHAIGLLLFGLTFLFGYLYSTYKNPILQYSVMLFAFPCLLLIISSIGAIVQNKLSLAIVLGVLTCGIVSTTLEKDYYNTYRFGTMKEIAEYTKTWCDEFGDNNVTRAVSVQNPFYINYYMGKTDTSFFADYQTREPEDLSELIEIVQNTTTDYFVYGWSTISQTDEIYEIILNEFPTIVEDQIFPITHLNNYVNSRITLFSKGIASRIPIWDTITATPPKIQYNDSISLEMVSNMESIVQSNQEFAETLILPTGRIGLKTGFYIRANIDVQEFSTAQLVVTIMRNGEPIFWRSSMFNHYVGNQNSTVFFGSDVTDTILPTDELRVYVWNLNQEQFVIENLQVAIYENRP